MQYAVIIGMPTILQDRLLTNLQTHIDRVRDSDESSPLFDELFRDQTTGDSTTMLSTTETLTPLILLLCASCTRVGRSSRTPPFPFTRMMFIAPVAMVGYQLNLLRRIAKTFAGYLGRKRRWLQAFP
jgi:hypothetical protein